MAFLIALFFVVLPLFQYLGPASIERFLWALPVSRTQIVLGRYLSALAGLALALVLPLSLAWVCRGLGTQAFRQAPMADLVSGLALVGLVWCTVLFLFLPFHFRFGGERGLGYFLGTGLIGCIAMVLIHGWSLAGMVESFIRFGSTMLDGGTALLRPFLGVLALGAASLGLSVLFYRRRMA